MQVTRTTEPRPAPAPAVWRRLLRWPVFALVGAVHILVLPLVMSERADQVLAIGAGVVYLLLAVLDHWWTSAAPARSVRPDRPGPSDRPGRRAA